MPTYVVTGASGGIGLATVRKLAARGDKVFATVRKRESTATGVDNISKVQGDVTVIEGIDVCSDDVGAKLCAALSGVTIDAIVHNAGGIANRDGPDAPKGMAAFADGGGGPIGGRSLIHGWPIFNSICNLTLVFLRILSSAQFFSKRLQEVPSFLEISRSVRWDMPRENSVRAGICTLQS